MLPKPRTAREVPKPVGYRADEVSYVSWFMRRSKLTRFFRNVDVRARDATNGSSKENDRYRSSSLGLSSSVQADPYCQSRRKAV